MEALIARSVHVLIALGGAYVLTLWFALVVWTFQDIQARSRNVVAQIFSTLVVMLFFLPGLLVYMILRPRYTLDDAFQRSLEEEYLLQDLEELPHCPGCQSLVEEDWVYCPNCRTELRDNCVACDRLIELEWEICPYCGTEQYGDPDEIRAKPAPPVITPHQPAYGWLERTMAHHGSMHELADSDQRTRPIIPATVRYDFRADDGIAEPLDSPPVLNRVQPLIGLGAPHRVSFEQNWHVNGTHSPKAHVDTPEDHHAEDIETDDVSVESTQPRRDV
jgi:RNA polymerase subunit RPABC4/transcription elongation factor Spt4